MVASSGRSLQVAVPLVGAFVSSIAVQTTARLPSFGGVMALVAVTTTECTLDVHCTRTFVSLEEAIMPKAGSACPLLARTLEVHQGPLLALQPF